VPPVRVHLRRNTASPRWTVQSKPEYHRKESWLYKYLGIRQLDVGARPWSPLKRPNRLEMDGRNSHPHLKLSHYRAGFAIRGARQRHLLSSETVAASHQIRTPRKVLSLDEAVDRVGELRRQGKRIVFTNGCFDLLHPGHTRYLAEARALGDALVVAVNSDRSVRELKGPGRPVMPQDERAELLAALRSVDYVTIFDDLTPRQVIARMLPNVLVKGADWGPNEIVGREEVEAAGGQVVSIRLAEGYSTSAIIEKIKELSP
jgi:D-glycero-beta-D-manno-heptose 1-phosphate adenylyltransferase